MKQRDYVGIAFIAVIAFIVSPVFGGLGAGLICAVIYCRKPERVGLSIFGLWAIPGFSVLLTLVLVSPRIWPVLRTDWENPTPWDGRILALSLLGFISFQGLMAAVGFTLSQMVIFRRRKAQLGSAENSSNH